MPSPSKRPRKSKKVMTTDYDFIGSKKVGVGLLREGYVLLKVALEDAFRTGDFKYAANLLTDIDNNIDPNKNWQTNVIFSLPKKFQQKTFKTGGRNGKKKSF